VVKTSSALVGPVFVRIGWWGALLIGGLVLLLLNAPYFLWRPEEFDFFWRDNVTGRGFNYRWNLYWPGDHGLLGFFENAILSTDSTAQEAPGVLSLALSAAVLAPSLIVTFFSKEADRLVLFAIWSCTLFLFYSWVSEFHYVMLLPALTLLAATRQDLRPVALAVFILLAIPTPYWLLTNVWNTREIPPIGIIDLVQESWPAWGAVVYHAWKPVPVALVWLYLLWMQARRGLSLEWLLSMPGDLLATVTRSSSRIGV
jgi:hypothetical protein